MELILQREPHLTAPPTHWSRAHEAANTLLIVVGRPQAEISVLLTDDAGIRRLNREWRGLDTATDVLSWPLEETISLTGEELLGDVAISVDTAARQAKARDWNVSDEIALLLVHGILHLLGHEDETEAGADKMREIETAILGKPLEKIAAPPDISLAFVSTGYNITS